MRLKAVRLKNFRAYREATLVPIESGLTGIIGRNDFGKSTILEALAIFFETEGFKADKSDMNCSSYAEGAEHFEIGCVFDEIPNTIVLDESTETTLAREYLLNSEGDFEVVKIFRASTGKLERTAIVCEHPNSKDLRSLFSLKMIDLKRLGEEKGVSDSVVDKRVASLWRHAIRDNESPIVCSETYIDVDKEFAEDGKLIWGKIQSQLPIFALFRSDRESTDNDLEAKNPLQHAVKEAQLALQDKIIAIEKEIETSVLDVAARTLTKLRDMAPDLANELVPRFKEKPKWTFSFTLDGEGGIPINKRGSGVRRLILLNFFRAEAEKNLTNSDRKLIYAIEEPETSQHPDFQVMLMNSLLELAKQPNRQIIVTTHVPALAGLIPQESLRYVTRDESGGPFIKLPSSDVLHDVARSLGILPEPMVAKARGVVLVEGKCDVIFLKHAAEKLKEAGHIKRDLDDVGIAVIPVGGCGNIKHWVTLELAKGLGLPWAVFLDSDLDGRSMVSSNLRHKDGVESAGGFFYLTKKREIENYISPQLVASKTGVNVEYSDTCDAKRIIRSAMEGQYKGDVIEYFWPAMSAQMIIENSWFVDGENEGSELLELILRLTNLPSSARLPN